MSLKKFLKTVIKHGKEIAKAPFDSKSRKEYLKNPGRVIKRHFKEFTATTVGKVVFAVVSFYVGGLIVGAMSGTGGGAAAATAGGTGAGGLAGTGAGALSGAGGAAGSTAAGSLGGTLTTTSTGLLANTGASIVSGAAGNTLAGSAAASYGGGALAATTPAAYSAGTNIVANAAGNSMAGITSGVTPGAIDAGTGIVANATGNTLTQTAGGGFWANAAKAAKSVGTYMKSNPELVATVASGLQQAATPDEMDMMAEQERLRLADIDRQNKNLEGVSDVSISSGGPLRPLRDNMGNRVYSSTGGLLRKKKRNPLASEQNADGYEYGDLNA